MVQGGDIWMNNPRRPLEACGTSGMKAMANGVVNLSTLDGWWDEAYRTDNSLGFAIGRGEEYDDWAYQDFVESDALTEKVFKVFHMHEPQTTFVPITSIGIAAKTGELPMAPAEGGGCGCGNTGPCHSSESTNSAASA